MNNLTLCNNCAGKIVLSLKEYCEKDGLIFCCIECIESFFDKNNIDNYPVGLAYDLGLEEYQ